MIVPSRAPASADVAAHYDTLDPFYRDIWGEHVHHGYWRTGRESAGQAAAALVDLVARHLELAPGQCVCDIGCGYGATAQALAEAHGVSVTGVTLSAVQQRRAASRVAAAGALHFAVQDWQHNTFATATFDRAFAIESTEHMADKRHCFSEAFRILRPGGRLVVCAWLAADAPRRWHVRHLLTPICEEGRLAGLGTEGEYVDMLRQAGFALTAIEDISAAVARTWAVCLRRGLWRLARDARTRRFLLSGDHERVFAITLGRMLLAFRTGALRYAVLTAAKPG